MVLLAASVLSMLSGSSEITIAILAVVLLNAIVGFVQEYRAQRAVDALTRLVPRRAHVIRDGGEREIAAEHVVRGDLVVLEEGAHVPADARLIE